MKKQQIALILVAGTVGALGGGVVAKSGTTESDAPQPRPTVTATVTETETVTETDTREVVPGACRTAIRSGQTMARLLDDYDARVRDFNDLFLDAYNTVDDAYNQGASFGGGFGPIDNTLDQLENRYDDLVDEVEALDSTWTDTAWYDPARKCRTR
jgi:hypothetical protein